MSTKRFKSLLEELDGYAPQSSSYDLIESRATHVVASVNNLLSLIKENYSEEAYNDLQKRLFSSLRSGDVKKFRKGIEKHGGSDD